MQPFTLPSFAKINLILRILGKRTDGFHELFTVFQTISLHDLIEFEPADELRLTCGAPGIPTDGTNLIIRAATALQKRFGVTQGAAIRLQKRIPAGGGLGGGSSNAATALFGLSRLWGLSPDLEELDQIAADLGSDVPFFLYGGSASGGGRGDIIMPVDDLDVPEMLVVTPQISVSTSEVFAAFDSDVLTSRERQSNLSVSRFDAGIIDLRHSELINDLERTVFAAYPEIERVKSTVWDLGAVNVAMSGSGASVFAIFDNTETRQAALKALDNRSTWRKFAVSTVSREQYRDALRC